MGIIFKFAIRNILERKFRTFLIIFAIMMSSALFFASGAMSGTVEKMVVDRIKKAYGTAEIMIQAAEKSPSKYVVKSGADRLSEELEYTYGVISGNGVYKEDIKTSEKFSLLGVDYKEISNMNPPKLAEFYEVEPFRGNKIIIGKAFAEKQNLKLRDSITIKINGMNERLQIVGLAKPDGVFMAEAGAGETALVPRDYLGDKYGMKGQYNVIYAKPKVTADTQEIIKELSGIYSRYTVKETVPVEDIQRSASTFTVPFMMMVVMVVSISIFIIFTSFKVITTEMLPVVGTFRSIGATRRMTDGVLIAQSLVYGVTGGLLGCGMGVGVLYGMANILLTPMDRAAGVVPVVSIHPNQFVVAFMAAVILSLISSLIPIIKVSKIPIKDIVLNKIENNRGKKRWKPILGLTLVGMVMIIPPIAPRSGAIFIDILCQIGVTVGICLLIPQITIGCAKIFERLNERFLGAEGALAAMNLRDNKNMMNNITLLAMGISALLMINTISFSVFKEVADAYRTFHYDIMFAMEHGDRSKLASVERVDGVRGVMGDYSDYQVETADGGKRVGYLIGADTSKLNDFMIFNIEGNVKEQLKELDRGRNIIITTALSEKLGKKLGDTIVFKTKTGDRGYRVTGFCSTLMYNGQTAIISDKYFKKDWQISYYSNFSIKTDGDPKIVEAALKEKFKDQNYFIMTIADMRKQNDASNANLFVIFNIFSVIAMIIGIFGVVNNFAISFMERKRSLAVLKSVGMSKVQIIRMIILEAITGGFIGGAVGVFAGVMLISVMPYLMKALDIPMNMHYNPIQMGMALLGGTVVAVIASVSPALSSSKLNIIDAIKYE